jgi:uncharacterized membrane protein
MVMITHSSGDPIVRIGEWIREGWEIFISDAGMFMLAGLVYGLLTAVCFPILFGPLACGMYLIIFERMKGGRVDIGRLFAGFDYFGQSLVAGLMYFALIFLGMILFVVGWALFILPSVIGIAVWVVTQLLFLFTFQLIVDRGMGATEAIAASYNKIMENLGEFLLFSLVLWAISAAGSSVMIGFIVSVPLTFAASAVAYRDFFGIDQATGAANT